jgi:hypothetical protein
MLLFGHRTILFSLHADQVFSRDLSISLPKKTCQGVRTLLLDHCHIIIFLSVTISIHFICSYFLAPAEADKGFDISLLYFFILTPQYFD